MYEIAESWRSYFEELDPKERLKRFNLLAGREDAFQAFCRTVYGERYHDPKHPERPVDTWLWKFVYLPGLYRRRKWMGRSLKKEMEKTTEELHLAGPETLSDMERAVLYLEFRNAARRYLSTCGGPRYASSFLGMKQATAEEKRARAGRPVWRSAFSSGPTPCAPSCPYTIRTAGSTTRNWNVIH